MDVGSDVGSVTCMDIRRKDDESSIMKEKLREKEKRKRSSRSRDSPLCIVEGLRYVCDQHPITPFAVCKDQTLH